MLRVICGSLLVAVSGSGWQVALGQDEGQLAKAAAEVLVHSARHGYERSLRRYEVGTETMEIVGLWSRRWLDAELAASRANEQKIEAHKSHLQRIKQL